MNTNGRENEVPLRITAGPCPPTASVSPSGKTGCGPLCLRDANATKVTESTQDKTQRHHHHHADDDAELEALLRGLENEAGGGGGGENFGV